MRKEEAGKKGCRYKYYCTKIKNTAACGALVCVKQEKSLRGAERSGQLSLSLSFFAFLPPRGPVTPNQDGTQKLTEFFFPQNPIPELQLTQRATHTTKRTQSSFDYCFQLSHCCSIVVRCKTILHTAPKYLPHYHHHHGIKKRPRRRR